MESNVINKTITELISKFPKSKSRIENCVNRVSMFWRDKEDGDSETFYNFCVDNFIGDEKKLKVVFEKLNFYFESIYGNFGKLYLDLRKSVDLDTGPIEKIDSFMSGFDVSAHLQEDLFSSKIAFYIILNFENIPLETKVKEGMEWSGDKWGYADFGNMFTSRLPAEINQEFSVFYNSANSYILNYYIYLGKIISDNEKNLFPEDLRLISHWGLRDEIKSLYSSSDNFKKQKILYKIMERIIDQSIPDVVINSDKYFWNPMTNKVFDGDSEINVKPENNIRYKHVLNLFNSIKKGDKYFPGMNDYIQIKFELEREMTENNIRELFESMMSSPQVSKVADFIKKRLNRNLEPFDIWYDGFKSRSSISGEKLDEIVNEKYPDINSFQNDIKNILLKLGFSQSQSEFVSKRVVVDPARGAGHAFGAQMRSEKSHLRTKFNEDGLGYKGYNIAIHELGHNTEQVFSLNKVKPYIIHGIPSTSFTEAFAFVFQSRDLEILGLGNNSEKAEHLKTLDLFWATFEMMGVALVDIDMWRWLYNNPNADEAQLKAQVISISKEIWNKYFAPHFGIKDQTILSVYSHMISAPLYLADYPIGRLISFQIEQYLKGKNLGTEMERMCSIGSINPQIWMKKAVNNIISAQPLLQEVTKALDYLDV